MLRPYSTSHLLLPVKVLHHTSWLPLLKAGVAGALLGTLWWYLDPRLIWESLRQMDGRCLLLAAALGGVGLLVQWVKWRQLLVAFRPHTTWGEGLQSLLIGFALGMVSPGRVGELGRGVFLGGQRLFWAGLVAVDRLCSASITVGLGWVGLVVLSPAGGLWALAALAALAVVGGGVALVWARAKGRLSQWQWLRQGRMAARQMPGKLWLQLFSWSALFNLIFFVQFYVLLRSWGAVPGQAIWGIPLFFGIKSLLPFSVMDLGVREGAAVVVFSQLHLEPVMAFNASFLLFVLNVLAPGLAGMALGALRLNQRLSQAQEEAPSLSS